MRVPLVAAAVAGAFLVAGTSFSQQTGGGEDLAKEIQALRTAQQDLDHRLDVLAKAIDDVAWFQKVGDVALIDKWRIAGPPDANPKNPTGIGAGNPVKFYT